MHSAAGNASLACSAPELSATYPPSLYVYMYFLARLCTDLGSLPDFRSWLSTCVDLSVAKARGNSEFLRKPSAHEHESKGIEGRSEPCGSTTHDPEGLYRKRLGEDTLQQGLGLRVKG